MFSNKEQLRDRTCAVLKRCSSDSQIGTSLGNQGRTTDQAISELDLKVVWEKDLPGVSGSVPGNRADIDEIIAHKKALNDFELLLVQDASRFTRAGQGHGQKLLYDLRAAGIKVYFVAEDVLVDDEMAEMYVSFLFAAARHAVKMLAYNATNGSTASYLADRSPHARQTPFGMDRMYSDAGVDRHILRNVPDGTQVQLDPHTLVVIRTFGKNQRGGVPNHYIKQKSETVRYIPGDPKLVAVVHLMFHLRLVKGWSFNRIAMHLNDNGIASPCGKEWHSRSVATVLLNPIYIGTGIRCRTTSGIYFEATAGSPRPSDVTAEELANHSRVTARRRPKNEWIERPQSDVAEFLPAELRELARARIEKHLAAIAEAKPKKPDRDRHLQSMFFLKGFLTSKQGGYKMTGRVGGKNGSHRTYAVSRGTSAPKTNNVLAHRIPAAPLESAVLEMLRQVLLNRPGNADAIKRLVAAELGQRRGDQENPEGIQKEILRKRRQLVALSDGISVDEDDVLTRKIAVVKAEIRALEERMKTVSAAQPDRPTDVGPLAEKMAGELEHFGQNLHQQDIPHIRRLLGVLVNRLEADLETKVVEVEFAIPSWLATVLTRHGGVGLDELFAYRMFNEAHPENGVILGTFHCDGSGRPMCYTCRRSKAAA